jgi:hypothetical protein
MQRINRIIAFASVSFVLLFIAKINKAGLHTAYFKTLADSEIRNSQDLEHYDLQLSQDFSYEADRKIDTGNSGSSVAVRPATATRHFIPLTLTSHYHSQAIHVPLGHFFRAVAPRAPTC